MLPQLVDVEAYQGHNFSNFLEYFVKCVQRTVFYPTQFIVQGTLSKGGSLFDIQMYLRWPTINYTRLSVHPSV